MPINAVSVLEICARPGAEEWLERCLPPFAQRLRELPGCVACGVTRSTRLPRSWVLSGYWNSPEAMVDHFSTVELEDLVRTLGPGVVSIRFGSFRGAG
ncbi:antibiotic biosynthesis monooxygenase [Metapseudomonas furukawaii]|uniref:putative quinol monooxygenase n=1 Tax=Metapseudomonas furukawaii TaxID=1149133 RepID=UPI00227A9E31|nr:antibiotic biosynthesis monooxygenase [Pseudomonas furukawaii]WAG80509.1 antibiotic biosynthesis monooxygenase [Pseudomonas furukawaii]